MTVHSCLCWQLYEIRLLVADNLESEIENIKLKTTVSVFR